MLQDDVLMALKNEELIQTLVKLSFENIASCTNFNTFLR